MRLLLCKWWKNNKNRYPTLALVARAFLVIPATQAKSERLNSTSDNIVTIPCSAVSPEHVAQLTFLHENLG